jgi:hypothetical protein
MSDSTFRLKESNNYILSFALYDENDDRIQLSALGTLLLTQYYYSPEYGTSDRYHLATINSRLSQNVKNTNDVAVSTAGTVTWDITASDTTMKSAKNQELHIALFTWKWSGKQNSNEFQLYVENINYAE